MKRRVLIVYFVLLVHCLTQAQNCMALFSYGAQFNTVSFLNQSQASNAHYYWNFGDGTSSYLFSPIHEFPTNGIYLTTLYVHDTISNCSDYYEMWLNIVKQSSDACVPLITDSIYSYNAIEDYLKILDLTQNCTSYPFINYSVGSSPVVFPRTFTISKWPGNPISTAYYTNGSSARAAFKTSPNHYNRNDNYQDCSANFEFSVVSESNLGQRIKFSAMNKNASTYNWFVSGLGGAINRYTDTISEFFQGDISFEYPDPCWYGVSLRIIGYNGCRDSLYQHFLIRKQSATYVGMNEINPSKSIQISVGPNPVYNSLYIEQGQGTCLQKLTLLNVFGQVVKEFHKPESKLEIDFENLPQGVYLLKAEDYISQKAFMVVKE